MKRILVGILCISSLVSLSTTAQTVKKDKASSNHLFIDFHQLEPGKVKFADVQAAHEKDLATQSKYGAQFLKFWVDEEKGTVYCLVKAKDSNAIRKTHAEAHGLLPQMILPVSDGKEAQLIAQNNLFLDVHYLGAAKVTANDVANAHKKDLEVEHKYGVNLINYWFNEKDGVVMCLAQAKDSTDLIKTHKEAHGLVPAYVMKVKQGQ